MEPVLHFTQPVKGDNAAQIAAYTPLGRPGLSSVYVICNAGHLSVPVVLVLVYVCECVCVCVCVCVCADCANVCASKCMCSSCMKPQGLAILG